MHPQEAATSTHDYLIALSKRPERVYDSSNTTFTEAGRDTGWPGDPKLTDADIILIRDTWNRLGSLIPYHSGGFYIPGNLSPEARYLAYSVLQSKEFGIRHTDLQMARIILQWVRPGDDDSDVTLVVTGWEHAYYAPLWACARMPPWLTPHIHPYEALTWENQRKLRAFMFQSIYGGEHLQSWEWVVAHVFGETERWFEGLLACHWGFRDAAEVLLVRLRDHWMRERPDVPFPLKVGGAYVRPVETSSPQSKIPEPAGSTLDQRAQDLLSKTKILMEEVRVVMNSLVAGESSSDDKYAPWTEATQWTPQIHNDLD